MFFELFSVHVVSAQKLEVEHCEHARLIETSHAVVNVIFKRHVLEVKNPVETVNEEAAKELGDWDFLHENHYYTNEALRYVVNEIKHYAYIKAEPV